MNFIQMNSQELTISETLDYINSKFKGGRKLELFEGGKLKLTQLISDYFYTGVEKNNMIPLKTEQISLNELSIVNKDFVGSGYPFGQFLLQLKCVQNKKGCVEYKIYDKNSRIVKAENFHEIDISNYDRDTNEKLFNAIRYLLSLAKNDSKYQSFDNDPFASENFNHSFEIISETTDDKIKLINVNGVYRINVQFGTIVKNFILDSGASEISISKNLEKELITKGLLKKEDYIEPGLFKIADGSIITCRRINIKQLKVGNFILKNITASIGDSDSPLLLGKSFLDKFNKWSIDNNSQTLILEK